MITPKTLQVYLEKVESAMDEIVVEIGKRRIELKEMEEQKFVFRGQIDTLKQLMESDPIVEIPQSDNIEEEYEKRFDPPGNLPEDEVYEQRQEKVYLEEAEEMIKAVDEHNRTEP